MFYEPLIFVAALLLLGLWLLSDDLRRRMKEVRRRERLNELVTPMRGQRYEALVETLGPPTELIAGASGRTLYVWKAPAIGRLPHDGRKLTITATVNEEGVAEETGWS
jgi:hypothetical protein